MNSFIIGGRKVARDSDHLMTSFQCDICHYRNSKGLYLAKRKNDVKLLKTIRRNILVTFWVRESSNEKRQQKECVDKLEFGCL